MKSNIYINDLSPKFKIVFMCASCKKPPKYNQLLPKYIQFKSISEFDKNVYKPDDIIPESELDLINKISINHNYDKERITWRKLIELNNISNNDLNLRTAYDLYDKKYNGLTVYNNLYQKYGERFYILSAGWGLIQSAFKIPTYDITFSNGSKVSKDIVRYKNDEYHDFNHLINIKSKEDIVFIGSPDYLHLFYNLTKDLENVRKIIFWKKEKTPFLYPAPNDSFHFIKYETNNNIAWHYELVTTYF
jgi:hypothetical protein